MLYIAMRSPGRIVFIRLAEWKSSVSGGSELVGISPSQSPSPPPHHHHLDLVPGCNTDYLLHQSVRSGGGGWLGSNETGDQIIVYSEDSAVLSDANYFSVAMPRWLRGWRAIMVLWIFCLNWENCRKYHVTLTIVFEEIFLKNIKIDTYLNI